MRSIGIVLIILGIVAFCYTGFTFTTKERVAELGPIEINKEQEHAVGWPPILGAVLLACGIIVLIRAKK